MADGVRVYVGIGSNVDRERHLGVALDALADWFGALDLSAVYESEAVGSDGAPYLNMIAGFDTQWSVATLSRRFKALEDANGRCRDGTQAGVRTLDLDILTYGTCVGEVDGVKLPRSEILVNAFVLKPLAELAPDESHPVCQQSYRELWQAHDSGQQLWPVGFVWRGRQLSDAVG
ncbi:2-amino-4-hydroxy-6-hydroxymethyldihydropteridine diphosphokinase [Marinobacter salinisoli]|uniref:2-amino-4-hydroxy-6-hydroxymethyldihydropteridine diphosphokinase n=1 Tax=Marinobacter salinisoli TaxID=2769486 RepID=A0ABX7MUG3_9GAMM|nr:2-amino-4-hydroxy-6-hydroxymethyldihydropteridine diphosphokinase [Marinobacter salinisoli]QSP95949.1 2-amino-4-hydroxy-6-hydroxymethyldihydropteridine diphosphokinase [Marinobacter salinisoli]